MNVNLLNVIKQIIAQYGDSVLSEPKRVSAFFADLAREEPKPQKTALVKCLELGFAQTFKNVPENERAHCKQKLAQRLHDEEGLDLALCEEALELLAAVLFGEEQKEQKNMCKNCGKELQEGWKSCPFCSTAVESQSIGSAISAISSISSGSGSVGYGIEIINPVASTPSTITVDITARCKGCLFTDGPEIHSYSSCEYYDCYISEAAEYDCGMKPPESSQQEQKRRKRNFRIMYHPIGLIIGAVFFLVFSYIVIPWLESILKGFHLGVVVNFIAALVDGFFPLLHIIGIALCAFVGYVIAEMIMMPIKEARRKNAKRLSPEETK